MSEWVVYLGSAAVVLLFVVSVYAMSASAYGDWVREFYAKRDRLQTSFGDESEKDKKSN